MSTHRLMLPTMLGMTLLVGAGCHTPRTTEQMRQTTLADLQAKRFAEAEAEVNALFGSHGADEPTEPGGKPAAGESVGDKQALIWHLERGMIAHLAGDRGLSSQHLDAAAALVDLRRTKTLVTEVGTGVANDTLRDYAGEPYEHIQVDYYRALDQVLAGQQKEGLYDPKTLVADFARPPLPPPGTPTVMPASAAPAALDPLVSYERAINFTRRMTLNQLKETVDAAGEKQRYQDDPFARVLAGALTYCMPPGERSESNRQYADVMFKTAFAAYTEEAKLLGGKQPFQYEVRKRPALLDTLLIRHCRAYNQEWFDAHLADFGLRADDPRLRQAELPKGHGTLLVLDHVDFITHPEVLDIRIIAASAIPVPVPTPEERGDGVTVTPFSIGVLGFYAKGPGSDIVNHWGVIPLPGDVVQKLLAPGGAAFMGFALPVHRPDRPNPPPGVVRLHPDKVGGSDIARDLEVVSDLDAYARATLKDEQPHLLTKTLIRFAAKQAAAAVISAEAEKKNELLGLAVNLLSSTAATLSEVADTRAWTSLPDHIEASLIDLPAGSYSLAIDTRHGAVNLGRVTIPENRLVVVPVRTFDTPVIVKQP